MSRIKEPTLGTTEIPNYKSPNSRIIRSLRTAYDKQREKNGKKAEQIVSLKGKIRDIDQSRYDWKEKALTSQEELLKLQQENEHLKTELKKRPRNY